MLYALDHLPSFVLLLAATAGALVLHGLLTALVAERVGDASARQAGRVGVPRAQFEPFGVIGALVGGVGWSAPLPRPWRPARGPVLLVWLVPALTLVAVGSGLLLAASLGFGVTLGVGYNPSIALRDSVFAGAPLGELAVVLSGLVMLYTGVLCLVPLPPLPGGRALFALGPRSAGWQQAEHQLAERNIGTAVLVGVLLLVPGLLYAVLDAVCAPLVRALTGG